MSTLLHLSSGLRLGDDQGRKAQFIRSFAEVDVVGGSLLFRN
jgi:hypothetical protein